MKTKAIIALVEEKYAYSKVTASLSDLMRYLTVIKKHKHNSPEVKKIQKMLGYYMNKRLAIDRKLEAE